MMSKDQRLIFRGSRLDWRLRKCRIKAGHCLNVLTSIFLSLIAIIWAVSTGRYIPSRALAKGHLKKVEQISPWFNGYHKGDRKIFLNNLVLEDF